MLGKWSHETRGDAEAFSEVVMRIGWVQVWAERSKVLRLVCTWLLQVPLRKKTLIGKQEVCEPQCGLALLVSARL